MSLLKKNKTSGNLDTLIGSKTIFEGVLMSNESLCIEGIIKGKVECRGSVVVGQGGKVKADITAENAFIGGEVNGNITTQNRLEITSAGRVKGNIETSCMVIAEGAFFEGSCHMVTKNNAAPSSPADSKSTLKKDPEIVKKPLQISSGES
jgi:cytoskeletal protein CcmA (bactofilin family)